MMRVCDRLDLLIEWKILLRSLGSAGCGEGQRKGCKNTDELHPAHGKGHAHKVNSRCIPDASARFSFVNERKRGRIDAVAKSRGPRSVGEDVAEVTAALCARHLDPGYDEARPAASRIELRARHEQQRSAARAMVAARFVIKRERAGKRPLRPFFPQHVILLWRQLLAPFGFGELSGYLRRRAHMTSRGT